eukprot:GHVT01049286.1.p1 GENE.GHVT01049286.1~~GHVT01049286.1.p1  ORF type:complete len:365 (+),score=52.18 GHVT01049286.1:309-1403(+)
MDKYKVIRPIGSGAQGQCTLVKEISTDTKYVMKEVRIPSVQALMDGSVAFREVEILRSLPPHPNIIRYVDSFSDIKRRVFVLVLEYADGGDLSHEIALRQGNLLKYLKARAAKRKAQTESKHLRLSVAATDGTTPFLKYSQNSPAALTEGQSSTDSKIKRNSTLEPAAAAANNIIAPADYLFGEEDDGGVDMLNENLRDLSDDEHDSSLSDSTSLNSRNSSRSSSPGEMDLFEKSQKPLRKIYLSEEHVLLVFVQLLLGLHHLHSYEVLHRDVKLQNIFLTQNGGVKLGDLGVAKMLTSLAAVTTTFIGTAQYMAPEIHNQQKYNHKGDMWALGCVLYELCTLRKTFNGQPKSFEQRNTKLLSE